MAGKLSWRPERSGRELPARSAWSQCGGDGFDFRVVVEHFLAHLAAPARLFVAAERQRGVEHVVAVDPHRAGADAAGELVGGTAVARPHTGGEAVDRVVGLLGDPVEIVVFKGPRAHHRSEDLLGDDLHVRPRVLEYGRRDKIAEVADPVATDRDLRT